jgi:hypothetical protein
MLEAVLRTMPEPDPVDVAELHMRTKIDDASARSGGGFQQAARVLSADDLEVGQRK